MLFLDVGLLIYACGLSMLDIEKAEDIMLINSGSLCEQYIGQHLLFSREFYQEPELHYWVREKKSSAAEVDYVITSGTKIIPIEVKAGKTGKLKSLHQFIQEKKVGFCIRINTDFPSYLETSDSLSNGEKIHYHLLSLPFYLAEQIPRLVRRG